MLKNNFGYILAKIGAKMWQPAFDKGYVEDYNRLTVSEKIGYELFTSGLKVMGIKKKTLNK